PPELWSMTGRSRAPPGFSDFLIPRTMQSPRTSAIASATTGVIQPEPEPCFEGCVTGTGGVTARGFTTAGCVTFGSGVTLGLMGRGRGGGVRIAFGCGQGRTAGFGVGRGGGGWVAATGGGGGGATLVGGAKCWLRVGAWCTGFAGFGLAAGLGFGLAAG